MPILHKSRQELIKKLQVGGSIPVYAQYQAQFLDPIPTQTATILASKYAQPAAAAKTETEKPKDPKDLDFSLENVLTSDGEILNEEAAQINHERSRLLNSYDNDAINHPLWSQLEQAETKLKSHIIEAYNEKKSYNDALRRLEAHDRGNTFATDSNGLVLSKLYRKDADGSFSDTAELKWVTPETVVNSQNGELDYTLKPLTSNEALSYRQNIRNSAFDGTILSSLRAVTSHSDLLETLDKQFDNLGISTEGSFKQLQNDAEKIATGEKTADNSDQLNDALNGIRKTMSNSREYKDYIAKEMITTGKSRKEAHEQWDNYLLTQLGKRLKISDVGKFVNKVKGDPESGGGNDGGGGGTQAPIAKLLAEISDSGNRMNTASFEIDSTFDKKIKDNLGLDKDDIDAKSIAVLQSKYNDFTNILTTTVETPLSYLGTAADGYSEGLTNLPWNKLPGKVGTTLVTNKAQDINGNNINDIKIPLTEDRSILFKEVALISNQPPTLIFMPTRGDGTIVKTDKTKIVALNEAINKIEEDFKKAENFSDANAAAKAKKEKIDRLISDFDSKEALAGGATQLTPMVRLQVIVPSNYAKEKAKEAVKSGEDLDPILMNIGLYGREAGNKIDYPQTGENNVVDVSGLRGAFAYHMIGAKNSGDVTKYLQGKEGLGEGVATWWGNEDFSLIDIFVPLGSELAIQNAQEKVTTDRDNININTISEKPKAAMPFSLGEAARSGIYSNISK